MRTSHVARATRRAAADRETTRSPSVLARVASCLVGLLLVLQLAGVVHPHLRPAPSADAKTIALASLEAAIGTPATLCDHGGAPDRSGDPAGGSCAHCVFCHSVAVGAAMAPALVASAARVAVATAVARPRADLTRVRARRLAGAPPRGPPAIG